MKRRAAKAAIKLRGMRPFPLQVLHLRAGDTLVVRVPVTVSAEQRNQLARQIKNNRPDITVMVAPESMTLAVLRKEVRDE